MSMHNIPVVVNRPLVVKKGWEGVIESNQTLAYFGEWAVFRLPMTVGSFVELRVPIDEAMDAGLVVPATGEEEYEESLNGADD